MSAVLSLNLVGAQNQLVQGFTGSAPQSVSAALPVLSSVIGRELSDQGISPTPSSSFLSSLDTRSVSLGSEYSSSSPESQPSPVISAAAAVFVNFDEGVESEDDNSDHEGDILASTGELRSMQELESEFAHMMSAQLGGEVQIVKVRPTQPCYALFVEVACPEEFKVEKMGEGLLTHVVTSQDFPEELQVTLEDFS